MPKKRYRPEEIIAKLREPELLPSEGKMGLPRSDRHIPYAA
jgi:hypothetical protein